MARNRCLFMPVPPSEWRLRGTVCQNNTPGERRVNQPIAEPLCWTDSYWNLCRHCAAYCVPTHLSAAADSLRAGKISGNSRKIHSIPPSWGDFCSRSPSGFNSLPRFPVRAKAGILLLKRGIRPPNQGISGRQPRWFDAPSPIAGRRWWKSPIHDASKNLALTKSQSSRGPWRPFGIT